MIVQEYELSLAATHAAMAYYYDHQSEIDQSIAESEAFAEEFRHSYPLWQFCEVPNVRIKLTSKI